ncbi:MAG: acyltransferase [Actinomycetota bacterium]
MALTLAYRSDLDGLRAFAVAGVLVYHSEIGQSVVSLPGGRIGVDVFFVLSGYLITTLLLGELDRAGRIDVLDFYARRALRLMPPFVLLLLIGWWVAAQLPGPDATPYVASAAGASAYVSNWVEVWRNIGVLGHTWSLGIEQQYYFVWPLVLGALVRTRRTLRRIGNLLVVVAVVIMIARPIAYEIAPRFAAFSTITRADGLLLGSALAMFLADPIPAVTRFLRRRIVHLVATTVVVVLVVTIGKDELNRLYLYGLVAVNVFAALIVGGLTVSRTGPVHSVLSWPPIVVIGRMSYAIYLFHVPVFYYVFKVKLWTGATAVAFALALTLALSWLSGTTIEAWARGIKDRVRGYARLRAAG